MERHTALPFDKNVEGFPDDLFIAGTGSSLSSVGEGGEGLGGEENPCLLFHHI